jgi:NAD+ kinase
LRVRLNGRIYPANILNDILICNKNPAAMSHYYLIIDGCREEQRSSGMWIATSAGSTGAIHSAGGKILPLTSDKFQYMPRELCGKIGKSCHFLGGVIPGTQILNLTSLMNAGMIYIDGAHVKIPFPFGTKISIAKSPYPLRMIRL